MTTREELLPEPIEPDPTGMRALLSSLPDPGPMPVELETQILARLVELRGEGEPTGLPQPPVRDHEADIVPLAAYGKDRPDRPRWLAAVAGIAAAAVLGIVVTDGLKGDGWVSSVVGGGSADSAAGGVAAPSGESKGADAGGARRDVFSASGTDYRAATLREQASALLVRPGSTPADTAADPAIDACLSALGVTSGDAPVIDRATYEGRPAYVVVWTRGGRSSVVVTGTSCGTGGTHLVAGPTVLG